jgi:hypothetical protein
MTLCSRRAILHTVILYESIDPQRESAMRRSVTMRIDAAVLEAAVKRAAAEHRSLTNYVEALLRRDLKVGRSTSNFEVIAPPNVRDSAAVALPDEADQDRARRNQVFLAVLDASGH